MRRDIPHQGQLVHRIGAAGGDDGLRTWLDPEFRNPLQPFGQEHAQLDARQKLPDALVRAGAEHQAAFMGAVEIHFQRVRIFAVIDARHRCWGEDFVALFHLHALEDQIMRDLARDIGDLVAADQFLDRRRN